MERESKARITPCQLHESSCFVFFRKLFTSYVIPRYLNNAVDSRKNHVSINYDNAFLET